MNQCKPYLIDHSQTLFEALGIIDKNGRGICFVTKQNALVGVISDGDIRRFLLKNGNLDDKVGNMMNRNVTSLPVNSSDLEIRKNFNSRIRVIPLVDRSNNVVDIADVKSSHLIPILEPQLCGKEIDYVTDCILSNWVSSQGKYVTSFQNMFEKMHMGTNALAVSSGTTALHLAIEALGISEHDEVIVPNITFASSANAVFFSGATPVLCEINPLSWCIDPCEAEKLITSKTKAIMVVHLFGNVCDMDAFMMLAKKYGLYLIEDCAEALGSKWKGSPVGTFGDSSIFSFFGNKTITTGEGGMVLFTDCEHYNKAKLLRDHGMNPNRRYWHDIVGYNYRLTNLQAAVGVAQLERFESILLQKLKISKDYTNLLCNARFVNSIPWSAPGAIHSNWLYTVKLSSEIDRDSVISELLSHGVEARPCFYPLHHQPPYAELKRSDNLMHSEELSNYGLCLPTSSALKSEDLEYICKVLINILGGSNVQRI